VSGSDLRIQIPDVLRFAHEINLILGQGEEPSMRVAPVGSASADWSGSDPKVDRI